MKLNLQDIVIDKDTQSRDLISEDTIRDYAEAMEDGAVFPPLIVFFDGLLYYLVDGYHRYFAYMKQGIDEVEVIVHKGTRRDAEVFSWGVNDKHGMQRSNSTKRKIVLKALEDLEYQDKSDRELAQIVKMSHTFILRMRKEHNMPKVDVKPAQRKPDPKPSETKPDVEVLKPVETMIEELDENDEIKELATLNQELHEENEKYKLKEMILEGDNAKVEETINELRKKIEFLEMENRSIKNSRDQFQAKNAELVKTVNYWKKKYEKLAKAD